MRTGAFIHLFVGSCYVGAVEHKHHANPIRKVVTMLQMMQNKVVAEGQKKEEIFNKFMCYCKNSDDELSNEVSLSEKKIPQLEASIEESTAERKQLEADLVTAKSDRKSAKEAIAKAAALREKEAAAFAKESGELKTNIDALSKAIPAISKGVGSGFLQTSSATVLRELSISMDMSSVDRDMLAAFLESKSGYAPQSGEILGILKEMKDEMVKSLNEATKDENDSIEEFDALVAAKSKEEVALNKAIESKTGRVGEVGVKIAELQNDLEDTSENLATSKNFLNDLGKSCSSKREEWAVHEQMQSKELLAIAETIKILNDDDALELFKKTLPSAETSFMQLQETDKQFLQRVRAAIHKHGHDPRVDFIELALGGKSRGVDKLATMIDKLVKLLKGEQDEDDRKKEFCEVEIDKYEDEKKSLQQDIADVETAIEDTKERVHALAAEIEKLSDGIRVLDKEVAEATSTRKDEHADFETNLAANGATIELLKFAKNRLNKFYNPKQYVAPAQRQLSEQERITVNMGGTLAPTAPPGGIAGTGIAFLQSGMERTGVDAFAPPAADLRYHKKSEENGGVIDMINMLMSDVEVDVKEMEVTEKNAQNDYEKFVADAASKRAESAKFITDKQSALAEADDELLINKNNHQGSSTDLLGTEKYISQLHGDCDWLLKYYSARKDARDAEVDSLNKAKDVLNGADFDE